MIKSNIIFITDENISYTNPQKISGTKNVTMSMRVNKIFEDAAIRITQKGNVIAEKCMKNLFPAEMIQIEIDHSKILNNEDIHIEVTK